MITVRELREELGRVHNQDAIVIMAGDEEGNNFYNLDTIEEYTITTKKDRLYLYPGHKRLGDREPIRDADGVPMPPKTCPTHNCLLENDLIGDWCPIGREQGINCLPDEDLMDPLDDVDDGD